MDYNLSDIRAATEGGREDGFGMGGGWLWIIVLFLFMFGLNGGGWGGRGNGLTQMELQQGFDTQEITRKLDGLANGLCDGFYAQNTTMLNGFNSLGMQIAENRFAAQQCCCETNRNIDALRYEAAKNTCDIVTAIKEDGAATRAQMTQNTIQELRDQLQAAQLQLGNISQTQTLVNELRPCARPAYITCSPYETNPYYGYNSGCGRCCN